MIRFQSLTIAKAPGLPDGVEIPSLEPGLNLILGPNASGKSTLVRVLLGALWPDEQMEEIRAGVHLEFDGGPAAATLRYGAVQWDPERPPLPPAEVKALLALDLRSLLEGGADDERFSRRLAVELMAGYDLEAASRVVSPPSPRSGSFQKKLDTSRTELRRLEGEVEALARRQDELEVLRRRKDAAHEASELARLAKRAAELAKVRGEMGKLRARLGAFPAEMERLHDDEAEELDRLHTDLEAARTQVAELRQRLELDRATEEDLKPSGRHPETREVETWRDRAGDLKETARELKTARKDLSVARARLEAARRGLGSWQEPAERLPDDALSRLTAALQKREELRATVQELEAAAKRWESWAVTGQAANADRLGRAVDALRSWLRTAPVEQAPAWPGWAAVGVGVLLVLLRWIPLGPPPSPPLAAGWLAAAGPLLLGAGGGFLVALRLVRRGTGAVSLDEAQRRATEAGLEPEAWEETAVRRLLVEAEEERDRLVLGERAAQRALDVRDSLERPRKEFDAAESKVRELAASLGLAPELPDLGLIEASGRIKTWVEARDVLAGLEGGISALESTLARGLRELGSWLETIGLPPPEDAAAAAAALEDLARRLDRLDELSARIARTEGDLVRAGERVAAAETALEAFWNRVGMDDRNELELHSRLVALPKYHELRGKLNEQSARASSLEADLEGENAWERLGLDPASFTEHQAGELERGFSRQAADYTHLVKEIAEIEQAIRQVEGGTSMEDARAAVGRAAGELAEHRDRAMEASLARFLIEKARLAQHREHTPRVLQRARRWFATFTHEAFHLEVGNDGALSAVDMRLQETRSLEELSDGTRIHLFLAVRLAALEEAEGASGPLPLALDETLSTTDPGRFRKIAGALLSLVREGRQLLYLTADPAEVGHWREACREAGLKAPQPFTLRVPAGAVAGWTGAPPLDAGTVTKVPPPRGLDPATWAQELGIPAPEPWRPAGAWHIIHLLPDRLETVHELLRLGYSEVGPLAEVLEAGGLRNILGPGERALLEARRALFTATLELWGRGRGRPVGWADVAKSGAVSPKFEDRVRKLVELHGHEPQVFLEAVRRLPRFHSQKAGDLEEYLRIAGVLPRGEALPGDLIVAQALDLGHGALEAAGVDTAAAAAYVRSLLSLLER